MPWWVPVVGALVVGALAFRKDAEAAVQRGNDDPREAHGQRQQDIAQKIREEAARVGLPPYIALATAQSESAFRHLPPRGSGPGRTFYPLGIQANRGADIVNRLGGTSYSHDAPEVHEALGELDDHIAAGVAELKRGWDKYGPDHERVRMWWVMPAYARRGRPWPTMTGSVSTARRLNRWNNHVAAHGGPPGSVPVA